MFRVLCFVLLFACVSCQNCTTNHTLVGESFELETFSHDVTGTLNITDDCEFEIQNFVYDGEGPQVYIYGVSSELENGKFPSNASSYEMTFLPQGEAYNGTTNLTVALPTNVTWDLVKTVSVWCVEFEVDFGSVVLEV